MWMGVRRIQWSWDCNKYHLLSYLLPNAELDPYQRQQKLWRLAQKVSLRIKKLYLNPKLPAVLSDAVPDHVPRAVCLAACCALGPWPRAFSPICPEWQPQRPPQTLGLIPGAHRQLRTWEGICSSSFSLHLAVLGSILGEQSSRTTFLSDAATSALVSPPDHSLPPF